MKCLHVCNDLAGSKVHENLYTHLEAMGLQQDIFFPLREPVLPKLDKLKQKFSGQVIGSAPMRFYHRILFRDKIRFLTNDLLSKTEISDYQIAHATNLFSDGAIAFKLFKRFGLPYIVAVRSTDAAVFLRFRRDLHSLGRQIVSNAEKLVFIGDSLRKRFERHQFVKDINLEHKCETIPNGLDNYWFNRLAKDGHRADRKAQPPRVLYVGTFLTRKNVTGLIQAVLRLRSRFPGIQLNLVGGGGSQEEEILSLCETHSEVIHFHGKINEKDALSNIYQSNDFFAMPSWGETFGLVYVEALSQGLPVLYARGEAIDGMFDKYVGEAVDPKSIDSITDGLARLIENGSQYKPEQIDLTRYCWKEISREYFRHYQMCARKVDS